MSDILINYFCVEPCDNLLYWLELSAYKALGPTQPIGIRDLNAYPNTASTLAAINCFAKLALDAKQIKS